MGVGPMSSQKVELEVGSLSETGLVREENQDRMSWEVVPLGHLFIVADGMGGHQGGAVAADLTVKGLQQSLSAAPPDASFEAVIHAAFKKVNDTVYEKAHSGDPATKEMGTTAVLLLITDGIARVAHVGDSRAYIYRNGQLRLLTKDHTAVQKMVDSGMLKPEKAISHPNASLLVRSVGSQQDVQVDISKELMLDAGDAFLLCSDGLSGYVSDSEIESVLRSKASVQKIPELLVNLALKKGGEDNVTVQFIQYGNRKETRPAKLLTQKKKDHRAATPLRHPLLQTALVLILVAAMATIGLLGYSYVQIRRDREKLGNDLAVLQEKLGVAEKTGDQYKKKISDMQNQINREVKDRKNASTEKTNLEVEIVGLEKKLKEAETFKNKATAATERVAILEQELRAALTSKEKADAELEKKQELGKKLLNQIKDGQEALRAKKKAENELKELQLKLDECCNSGADVKTNDYNLESPQK